MSWREEEEEEENSGKRPPAEKHPQAQISRLVMQVNALCRITGKRQDMAVTMDLRKLRETE